MKHIVNGGGKNHSLNNITEQAWKWSIKCHSRQETPQAMKDMIGLWIAASTSFTWFVYWIIVTARLQAVNPTQPYEN